MTDRINEIATTVAENAFQEFLEMLDPEQYEKLSASTILELETELHRDIRSFVHARLKWAQQDVLLEAQAATPPTSQTPPQRRVVEPPTPVPSGTSGRGTPQPVVRRRQRLQQATNS